MDGTLLDTEKYYSQGWLVVADEFGLERKTELPLTMSGTSWSAMPDLIHRFYPDVDANAYIKHVIAYAESEAKAHLEIMPGTLEILSYFQSQKIPMAVASSSNKTTIEEKLQRVGILKYFDTLVGGDEVEKGKPDPEIFLKAASSISLTARDCYVFEDSFNGVRAGYASGALTVMIPDQVVPTDEIRKLCIVKDSLLQATESIKNGDL